MPKHVELLINYAPTKSTCSLQHVHRCTPPKRDPPGFSAREHPFDHAVGCLITCCLPLQPRLDAGVAVSHRSSIGQGSLCQRRAGRHQSSGLGSLVLPWFCHKCSRQVGCSKCQLRCTCRTGSRCSAPHSCCSWCMLMKRLFHSPYGLLLPGSLRRAPSGILQRGQIARCFSGQRFARLDDPLRPGHASALALRRHMRPAELYLYPASNQPMTMTMPGG